MDGREARATLRLAAVARSIHQAGHGNLPILLEAVGTVQQWAVVSRTGRVVYTLTSQDGCASITCDCPAATDQCWHVVHIRRALAGEITYRTRHQKGGSLKR